MIIFIKNIIAIIYLRIIFFVFKKKTINTQKNLLFINTDQIGDLVISSTLLEEENRFEDYDNVYLLIKSKYKDLFRNYNGKIHIIVFDHKRFKISLFYNFKFVKYLKSLLISEVYNISPSRGQINEILTHLTDAQYKYTTNNSLHYLGPWFLNYWNRKYSSLILTNIENEYEKMRLLLLSFNSNKSNIIKIKNAFASNGLKIFNGSPYIVITPYSSSPIKNWDISNYQKIINDLIVTTNICVVCSADQKRFAAKDFEAYKGMTQFLISTVNLSEVASVISSAKLFIGNDSGLTHLALKLNVNTIAVIGGGTFGKYFPVPNTNNIAKYFYKDLECFKCNWVCKYAKPICLYDVSAEEVLEYIYKFK
jgi:ADP-heptose:LPS heptosyltransferase